MLVILVGSSAGNTPLPFTASLVRRVSQEDSPFEERTFLVAERDSALLLAPAGPGDATAFVVRPPL